MKKTIILLCFIGVILACNSNENSEKKPDHTDASPTSKAEDPEVTRGLELIAKSDCLTCHKVIDASTGPPYEAVAAKYPDNDAVIDSVSKKIITGGSGNWGTVPMTPHPDISEADAKAMVKYVLSLK